MPLPWKVQPLKGPQMAKINSKLCEGKLFKHAAKPQKSKMMSLKACGNSIVGSHVIRAKPYLVELMVIRDNSTRWNSTFDSMMRAIDLYPALQLFSFDHEDDLGDDKLQREDWDDIKEECAALRPFKELTIELQSQATSGNHGSVWETLPALELLLEHMEQLKYRLVDTDTRLAFCVNNSWKVLQKYYKKSDENLVYAMATLLNPTLRLSYFEKHWTGELASFIPAMKTACHEHWKETSTDNDPTQADLT